MLSAALERLEAGDEVGCLRLLLDRWRKTPFPELGDAIDLVSARITRARGPISGKTLRARTERWLEIEAGRDPGDVERLLQTPWPGRWADAMPILERVVEWPSDPRVAMALARIADEVPYDTWTSAQFYVPLLERIEEIADPRVLRVLGSKAAPERPRYYRALVEIEERSLETIRARSDRLGEMSAADRASLDRLLASFRGELAERSRTRKNERELLEAIYRDPHDDDVRQVYADALSERGDPRGELITIQLIRARDGERLTDAMKRREHALLARYDRSWVGELAAWINDEERRFERGFLARASLAYRALHDIDKVFALPAWGTLRVLDVGHASTEQLVRIMRSPLARHLEGLTHLEEADATWLARGIDTPELARRLTTLGVMLAFEPVDRSVLANAEGLPVLRHLELLLADADELDWLPDGALWKRLESLVLSVQQFGPWVRAARRSPSIRELEIRASTRGGQWLVVFRDDSRGRRLRAVSLEWEAGTSIRWSGAISELADVLRECVGLDLTELVVAPSRALRMGSELRQALEGILTQLDTLERIDVPWDREALPVRLSPSERVIAEPIHLLVDGGTLFPHVREILDDLTARKLAPQLDTFIVNYGVDRAGGKDLPRRIATWASKETTSTIAIFRDGMRQVCEVSLGRYRFDGIDNPRLDPTRWSTLLGSHASFTLTASREAHPTARVFVERYLDWVCALFERYPLHTGYASYRLGHALQHGVLDLVGHSSRPLGWLTILGEHYLDLLPRADLERLPDDLASDGVRGVSLRTTTKHVILVNGETPDAMADPARVAVYERHLSRIYRAAFRRKYGHDPYDGVAEALGPSAEELGFELVREGVRPQTTIFVRRRKRRVDAVVVRMNNAIRHPLLHVTYKTDLAERVAPDEVVGDASWRCQWVLRCPDEHDGAWPATRSGFESSIAAIRAHLTTSFDEWCDGQDPTRLF